MSFQKAHQISNELAEVVVSTRVDLASAANNVTFPHQPAVSGKSFRILEIGFTVGVSGSAAVSDDIEVGIESDHEKFIKAAGISGVQSIVPADPAVGATFSTSKGGSNTWIFNSDGLDNDGNAVLSPGESLSYSCSGVANGSHGNLFVRLAPILSKDVFE